MKRFYLGLWLSLLVVSFGRAQSRFSLIANASPVYTHVTYTQVLPTALGGTLTGSLDNYGYTIGLGASYQLQPKWTISTGFWYNYQADHLAGFSQKTSYFQVPLLVNYKPSVHRLSPYFSGGLVGNYHYKDRVDAALFGGSSGEFVTLKFSHPYYLSALLGIGAAYSLNSHTSFVIQPYGQYRLGTPNLFTDYTYLQVGISTQVHYRF